MVVLRVFFGSECLSFDWKSSAGEMCSNLSCVLTDQQTSANFSSKRQTSRPRPSSFISSFVGRCISLYVCLLLDKGVSNDV